MAGDVDRIVVITRQTSLQGLRTGILLVLCTGCPGGEQNATEGTTGGATTGTETETETDTGVFVPRWDQVCELAPPIFSGVTPGTFHEVMSTPSDFCGESLLPLFAYLDIDSRVDIEVEVSAVGFEPRVFVVPANCNFAQAACYEVGEQPLVLPDFQPGSRVQLAVAVPGDHPELMMPAPDEGPRNLDFEVVIGQYPVREVGERCGSKQEGRCAPGGVCQPTDPENLDGLWMCVAASADDCSEPQVVEVSTDILTIELDPSLQSDAHHHSCTGEGRPERVLAVELPVAATDQQRLVVRSPDDVGIAIRAPGCLVDDEQVCVASAHPMATQAVLEGAMTAEGFVGLHALRVAGVRPLVFVELPAPGVGDTEEPPVPPSVTVELVLEDM